MDYPIHRFRHNTKAIAVGNPGWEEARESHLIDLKIRVAENDRLVIEDTGFQFLNLSSCSYLGLHEHPALIEGAIEALRREKVLDVPISRVRIRLSILDEFEERLAGILRARSIATVTATAASSAVLPLLASGHLDSGEPRVMVFDKFCHFSMNLLKPICADETLVLTAPHNDVNYLEDVCKKHSRVAYVADGVYSLGGAAPVKELMELQDRYGLFLFFDDSHSLSVCGKTGEGYVRSLMGDELNPLTVIVASLCKGFGGSGGVIMLGATEHEDILMRFGGPLAWSQKLNTAGIGAGLASIDIHESPELGELQAKLHRNTAYFDSQISTEQSGDEFTIRLVVVGDEVRASEISGEVFRRGFYTSPVFFPIVQRGKAGLRVMLRADNRLEDIQAFCSIVKEAIEHSDEAKAAAESLASVS
ncbi:MAG TPA: aminotransferase class I/II-fold pyridoxal phosphate-dependent enzyme [Thermoanaerobaculia bacterium]|nr:aminotransferase class I/II-fold pyridoxal phosphate-dependent enzyme [Thermoanaerobaculia bacterium]